MGRLAQILFFTGLLVAAVSAAPSGLEAPHPLAAAHPYAPSTGDHEETEGAGHEETPISENHGFGYQAQGEEETPEHAAEGEQEPEHTFEAGHETETEPEHTFEPVHETETEPEHTFEPVHGTETEPEHTFEPVHGTETEHRYTRGVESEPEHVPEDTHATENEEDVPTTEAPLSPFSGHEVPPFGFKDQHESEDVLPEIPPPPHSAPTFGAHH